MLVWQYAWSRRLRREQLDRLDAFFDALRDINRRVYIDTYVQFHFTKQFRHHSLVTEFVTPEFLVPLGRMHDACEQGRPLSDAHRREVFLAHFLHEQETVVAEQLSRAARELAWPLVKYLALRPRVRFAYLPAGVTLPFGNFADTDERIRNGLRAFDLASQVGWARVELTLASYGVLPPERESAPMTSSASNSLSTLPAALALSR